MASNIEVVSKEEFSLWKENKVTKVVTEMLQEVVERNKAFVFDGGTISDTGKSTAEVVGFVQGVSLFLALDVVEEEVEIYGH